MEDLFTKLFLLIVDYWLFLLFISIPILSIKFIIKTVKLFFFLYKNNRSGRNNGHSKHFADRLLEIYLLKGSAQYKSSSKFNQESVTSGSVSVFLSLNIEGVDNYLIHHKLVIKKLDSKLEINTESLEVRIKNIILINIFKFISKYIYLDKNLF